MTETAINVLLGVLAGLAGLGYLLRYFVFRGNSSPDLGDLPYSRRLKTPQIPVSALRPPPNGGIYYPPPGTPEGFQLLEATAVVRRSGDVAYRCPCCHYVTLESRGNNEICGVCYWRDTGVEDPQDTSTPNGKSLREARANFAKIGASDPRFVEHVRPPSPDEIPSPWFGSVPGLNRERLRSPRSGPSDSPEGQRVSSMFPCPVCGHLVHTDPVYSSKCPICGWINTWVQALDPGWIPPLGEDWAQVYGADFGNRYSLAEAQINYARHGTSDENQIAETRSPTALHPLDADWRLFDPDSDRVCQPDQYIWYANRPFSDGTTPGACEVCGFLTLDGGTIAGGICSNCGWCDLGWGCEFDPLELQHGLSLADARINYLAYGYADRRWAEDAAQFREVRRGIEIHDGTVRGLLRLLKVLGDVDVYYWKRSPFPEMFPDASHHLRVYEGG